MKLKHLTWKLLYPFLILIVLSLVFFGYYTTTVFKSFYISSIDETLISRTNLIKEELNMLKLDSLNLNEMARKYDSSSNTRITIIDLSGKVLADSREDPSAMENHRSRPEVVDAIAKTKGQSIRYSHTLQIDMMYSAELVTDSAGKPLFVLRTAIPLYGLEAAFSRIYTAIIFSGVVIVLLAFVISVVIASRFSRPLTEMREAAESYARGGLDRKIYPPKDRELRSMAESLNSMASQLNERLAIIGEQKNIQQAIFESMKEGVLAIDYNEEVLLINNTAEEILGIKNHSVKGRTLQELVRISEIQKFFRKIISEGNPLETEIVIQHDKDKVLQLSGAIIKDVNSREIGVLVVINDITNLKHLDTIKRDLVANVSHELKTPVTTIKGFIETLQDGAIKDADDTERFLNIISKHIDRINLIIDDLLTLAKLEENSENDVQLEVVEVKNVLKSVVEDYEFKAKDKNIKISIQCSDDLKGPLNVHLIEQALSNLLDNAIKYSNKKTKISLGAYEKDNHLNIYVDDEGYGIAEEHIPRLFERFYTIDKARSREVGGTGLGLAIVKHIMNILGGKVEVESHPGKGSNFVLRLPVN